MMLYTDIEKTRRMNYRALTMAVWHLCVVMEE